MRIVLQESRTFRLYGRQHKVVTNRDEMMYIPLLKTLERMLKNNILLSEVLNGHQSTDGILRDYCDGESFQQHPLYSNNIQHLQIIFYFDELEICNPLGSYRKKHKLGMRDVCLN